MIRSNVADRSASPAVRGLIDLSGTDARAGGPARRRAGPRRVCRAIAAAALVASFHALAPAPAAAQEDGPFARHPAVSPDGRTVAFSWQGDIWTVPVEGGMALRLTIHEAYESRPRFSPDGSRIAFVSERHGNADIFVMGADGSNPRRVTHHSANDELGGWTPDGRLVFETARTWRQVERENEIHHVSAEGGTPERLLDALGYSPAVSPDGRFIAFVRGSNGEFRKGYRGSANREIWIHDTRSGGYVRFTEFDGNDMHPAWAGPRTLLFLSERGGAHDLYRARVAEDGRPAGEPERLTRFAAGDDGIRAFGASADGSVVVFERRTDLFVLDGSGEPRRLEIRVSEDARTASTVRRTFTDDATEFAVSPDGRLVAFVVRGEVFVTTTDEERRRTVRLTDHPWRDHAVAWVDDRRLIFTSDRTGRNDLYLLESADPAEPDLLRSLKHRAVRLTDTPEVGERRPVVSPDGKSVAFLRGVGTLVVARLEGGALADERVLLDGWAEPENVAWSPDSRWLAYDLPDLDFNREVYIQPADGSRDPVNVTRHPKSDGAPVWSADGRKLAFLSTRNNGDSDVWFVWLREEDWERTRRDWEERAEPPAADRPDGTGPARKAAVDVVIDFEGIHDRLRQVTSLPGNESDLAVSADGETFFFVANRDDRRDFDADQDLYRVKWDGTEAKALTTGNQRPDDVVLGPEGEHLYFSRPGGRLARVPVKGGSVEGLSFAARMEIDRPAERAQIFDEAWRVLELGFYDPGFHGQDWEALRERYRPWALKASTDEDFRDVFNMMLGELNASHLGLRAPRGGDGDDGEEERTGLLGVEVRPVDGGVRVERVVPNSPADREESRLFAGDVIAAVDGVPVEAGSNFWALLADRAGERTPLSVRGSDGREREVVIRPTESLRDALYDEWVEERRRLTERYSGGRLGYIHIQGMNWPSFERFERELVAAGAGKEGLVVDVRFNGGGWTTDYLLAVLTVRQHAYTVPRGAAEDLAEEHTRFREHYPFGERLPLAAWTRPTVALCNRNSFSNAEIFSHAFKTLGLGTLVGEPTFGAVISTGSRTLIDGSSVRLPFRGWFVKATGENMENGPAVPDVVVLEAPGEKGQGEDAQLEAAVRTLLAQIDGLARRE